MRNYKPYSIRDIVLQISKLEKHHQRQAFDCGVQPLNHFIQKLATQMLKRSEVAIYIACDDTTVAGFYTLSACEIHQADDPKQLKKHSPHIPIPCVLLGRLAVDKRYQSRGLGGDLLLNALIRCKALAGMLGVAFVVVDAKDEAAKRFYEQYGFIELQHQPMRLCLAIRSIPD